MFVTLHRETNHPLGSIDDGRRVERRLLLLSTDCASIRISHPTSAQCRRVSVSIAFVGEVVHRVSALNEAVFSIFLLLNVVRVLTMTSPLWQKARYVCLNWIA